jgi:hypothetical protein
MFSKIASKAGEKYGSEERGKKVAGAILKRIRAKHMKEDSSFNTALQELVSYSKMTASGVSKPVTKAQDYSQTDEAPAPTETKPVVGSSSRPNAAQAMSKLDAMPKPKAPASAVAGRTKYVGSQNIRPAAPAQAAPAQTSSARPKVNAPLPPVKPAEIKGSVTSAPRTSTVPSSGGSTSTTGPTPVGGANIGPNAGRTTAPKPAASTPVAKPAATTSTDTYSGGRNKAAFDAAFNKARELGGSTARFTFDNKQYQAAKTKDEYVSSKAQKDVNIGDLSKNVAPTATPASITPTSSSGGSSNPPGASTGDVTPKGTSDAMRDPEYGRQKKETGSSQQTFAESFVSVGTNKYRIV